MRDTEKWMHLDVCDGDVVANAWISRLVCSERLAYGTRGNYITRKMGGYAVTKLCVYVCVCEMNAEITLDTHSLHTCQMSSKKSNYTRSRRPRVRLPHRISSVLSSLFCLSLRTTLNPVPWEATSSTTRTDIWFNRGHASARKRMHTFTCPSFVCGFDDHEQKTTNRPAAITDAGRGRLPCASRLDVAAQMCFVERTHIHVW